jgi:hypothetical protein
MKKILSLLIILLLAQSANAAEFDDLKEPKAPAYRVGTTNEPEKEYKYKEVLKTEIVKNVQRDDNLEGLTYADLSIKKISKEISSTLELDSGEMAADLSLLWQGAATKSDTIKFALYKLSNPDSDKPDDKSIKKVLTTIANMSTLVGAGIGNPLIATGAMIGGNMLGILSQDTKALNYKYTKVNDADMIILVRKVEDLQQNVVNRYYDYITARKLFDMTTKMSKDRHDNYKLAQNGSKELVIITDAYYREALDMQMKARSDYYSKRAALEQLVGNDVFKQFEASINSRN